MIVNFELNKYYLKFHYILPHNGIDSLNKMICVCPNCHVLLDLKSTLIEKKSFLVDKHKVNDVYITTHNL